MPSLAAHWRPAQGRTDCAHRWDTRSCRSACGPRQAVTIGNDTLEDGDYAGSVAARQTAQGTGPFRSGQNYGGGFARFGEAYVPYTSHAQGAGGGSTTEFGIIQGEKAKNASRAEVKIAPLAMSRNRTILPQKCDQACNLDA
jgi:hypothetical protein